MTVRNKRLMKWGVAAACALVALACVWVGMAVLGRTFHIEETTYLYIDPDDTVDSVRAKVASAARPGIEAGFGLLAAVSGYEVKTGRYSVSPADHMLGLFRRLKHGRQQPLMLTVPSVRTLDRLAGRLGQRLMLDSAYVAQQFADSAFCSRYERDTSTLVCLFVPNTYEVYWNISLEGFMERMVKEYTAFWNQGRLAKAEAAGLTPDEVATLASIVDEETANDGEKPMVAGMYINRLRCGMPLQADPTVKFALKDFGLRRIYHKHLDVESPYNTYRNAGLPPGPIRIASVAGIDAVLDHVEHDYLYMCAKEDFSGTHNFARTYREHLTNAARYTKALNRRGIR